MSELYHYGVIGMHWGVRKYQREDGTLTPAGKARYREALSDVKSIADSYVKSEERRNLRLQRKAGRRFEKLSKKVSVDTAGNEKISKDEKLRKLHDKYVESSETLDAYRRLSKAFETKISDIYDRDDYSKGAFTDNGEVDFSNIAISEIKSKIDATAYMDIMLEYFS